MYSYMYMGLIFAKTKKYAGRTIRNIKIATMEVWTERKVSRWDWDFFEDDFLCSSRFWNLLIFYIFKTKITSKKAKKKKKSNPNMDRKQKPMNLAVYQRIDSVPGWLSQLRVWLGSGHDLRFVSSSPTWGLLLSVQSPL